MDIYHYNLLNLELLRQYVDKFPELPLAEIFRNYFGRIKYFKNSAYCYCAACDNLYDDFTEIPQYNPDTIFGRIAKLGYERAQQIFDSWYDLIPKEETLHDYYSQSCDERNRPLLEFFESELIDEFHGYESFDDISHRYDLGPMTEIEIDALQHLMAGYIVWDGVRSFIRDEYGVTLRAAGSRI